jgi:hypothetical protein
MWFPARRGYAGTCLGEIFEITRTKGRLEKRASAPAAEGSQEVFALRVILTCRCAIGNDAQSLPFVRLFSLKNKEEQQFRRTAALPLRG